jgi:S1-C subfamily serine protease
MPVTVVCPACSATLPNVPDHLLGKSIKCTACREPVKVVPAAETPVRKAVSLPPLAPPPPSAAATPVSSVKVARTIPAVVAPPPPAEAEAIDVDVIEDDDADDEVIDVEVMADEPPPPTPPKRVMVTKSPPQVPARRPVEEDDEPAPAPRSKRRPVEDADQEDRPKPKRKPVAAGDADDRPAKKPAARKGADAGDDDAPRSKARRGEEDEEYRPKKKKSALPLVLGLLVGLVVIGGGAVAVVLLTKQPEAAQGTTGPVWVPPPNVTPPTDTPKPTEPAPPPTTPATRPAPTETRPTTPPATTPKPPATTPKLPDPPVQPVNRDRISDEALAKLKSGTVYIEVDDGMGGGGTGSGWFGGEPGLIVTNAHVLGMLYPGAKEPAKITVFTESGVKGQQKQYEGQKVKVLAVDREMDLGILQIINESDLPAPLPTRPAAKMRELDKLVCLGFPGGRRLAERNRSTDPPNVTVTSSAISAFRTADGGNLNAVQIQGGVVHGNSGGPVCDLDGNVIGVAVRVDIDHRGQMTNIAYAVPVEYVGGLLAGRAAEAVIGQGYVRGDRVVYPVAVRCADAMGRLKSVGVGVWVGEKGKLRPAGDTHTEAGGDIGYREVPLVYDKAKKVATGEIDYPRDTDGRVYWAQAFYANSLTTKRYLAGNPLPVGDTPVERVIADLTPRFPVGTESTLTVTHRLTVNERQEKGGGETFARWTMSQTLKASEQVEKSKAAAAHAQLDLVMTGDDAKLEYQLPGEPPALPKDLHDAKEAITKWGGLVAVARDGRAGGSTVTQLGLPPALDGAKKDTATRLAQQWAATATESLVRLPGKKVNAGDTWTDSLTHTFKLRPELLLADARGAVVGTVKEEVTYTYLGRRDRAGRGEVVLKVDGLLRPVGSDSTTCGSVDGRLVVDEKTGVVLSAEVKREFDLEGKAGGTTVRATGSEVVKVSREK